MNKYDLLIEFMAELNEKLDEESKKSSQYDATSTIEMAKAVGRLDAIHQITVFLNRKVRKIKEEMINEISILK